MKPTCFSRTGTLEEPVQEPADFFTYAVQYGILDSYALLSLSILYTYLEDIYQAIFKRLSIA